MSDKCQHWSRESGYAQASLYAACPWCEIEKLRGELSLAEEGLANATQEIEAAKHDIERLMAAASAEATEAERLRYEISRLNHRCQAMGWLLYPHSDPPREAVAGDVGWPG